MFQPSFLARPFAARLRERLSHRAAGIVLALVLEAILILLLLTLGRPGERREEPGIAISTFDVASPAEEAAPVPESEPQEQQTSPRQQEPRPQAEPQPQPPVQQQPQPQAPPAPSRPALIPMPRGQMPDIASIPSAPAAPSAQSAPAYGPANTPREGDSVRVGTAPDGKPLYAAQWYREPYESELAGYLSTAQGPGWGLIACKTAPQFRVEQCVALDESPAGSQMARAVLAAAWQFQVRPPRLGGRPMYGEWVRIRIDYRIRRN